MSVGKEERKLRSPIVVVLGHVDHGKTTLLDKIRGTAVVKKEPGEMTQHVGASFVPARIIEDIAKPLKRIVNFRLRIPGLLFIDTPGHEAFANLRQRSGSIADFAILVIDILDGVKPQTVESIEILRARKVPFLVAANKIDRIDGWRSVDNGSFIENLRNQSKRSLDELDRLVYRLAGQLSNYGFVADRFDRIKDFRRTVAIVPVSARTGEGLPELLAVLAGLTQQFMIDRLIFTSGPARGVVLEVKEEPGLGTTIDCIIYDGILKKHDTIVLGGRNGPITTKVRVLLQPKPLDEMRAPSERFNQVDVVVAAAGVKIAAPGLEDAMAGSPLYVAESDSDIARLIKAVEEELSVLRFKSQDIDGVIVKADTLGTLEALVSMLNKHNIPVRLADVGPLTKREALEAVVVSRSNRYLGVVMLFNVGINEDALEVLRVNGIRIFSNNIIYRLIEEYLEWVEKEKKLEKARELEKLYLPGKIRVIPGYVFRRSDPAVVGVEILGGRVRPGYPLMRVDGRSLGTIMQIQDKGKPISEAKVGMSVAISIRGNVMVGRHFDEGDILYVDMPEEHINIIVDKFADELSIDDLLVIKEIIDIKRRVKKGFGLASLRKIDNILKSRTSK